VIRRRTQYLRETAIERVAGALTQLEQLHADICAMGQEMEPNDSHRLHSHLQRLQRNATGLLDDLAGTGH